MCLIKFCFQGVALLKTFFYSSQSAIQSAFACLKSHSLRVLPVIVIALLAVLSTSSPAWAKKSKRVKPHAAQSASNNAVGMAAIADQDLFEVYNAMAQGRSIVALNKLEYLIQQAPNYKLLHMLRADLLVILSQKQSIQTNQGSLPVLPALTAEQNNRFRELRDEAQLRMISRTTLDKIAKNELLPKYLLKLADNEPYAIVVDGRSSRLYLYQNQKGSTPKLIKDFYITQGKLGMKKSKEGDNRTPVGTYFTQGRMPGGLGEFYGAGALPLDYPNAWDKSLGRTGHGIWLHGTPAATYARPPYASEGCVVLPNPDISVLLGLPIASALPVVLTETIEWTTTTIMQEQKRIADSLLEQWNHFAPNLDVKINPASLLVLEYPGEANTLLTKFQYTTAAGIVRTKQIFWKKTGSSWAIALET